MGTPDGRIPSHREKQENMSRQASARSVVVGNDQENVIPPTKSSIFHIGDRVTYRSVTHNCWCIGTIEDLRDDGSMKLDIKKSWISPEKYKLELLHILKIMKYTRNGMMR